MLADRQEFEVGEAEIVGITRKLFGEIAISQPFIIALAPPRAQMDFVNRHWRAQRIDVGRRRTWMRQPGLVENDGRSFRANFRGKGKRIGLQRQMLALWADHIEFVMVARGGVGHEQLPISDTRTRIGCRRGFQKLKSPTTLTRRALGASTTKATPSTPSSVTG